jgi:hypothetical protein
MHGIGAFGMPACNEAWVADVSKATMLLMLLEE